jgi:hypothetical protein
VESETFELVEESAPIRMQRNAAATRKTTTEPRGLSANTFHRRLEDRIGYAHFSSPSKAFAIFVGATPAYDAAYTISRIL